MTSYLQLPIYYNRVLRKKQEGDEKNLKKSREIWWKNFLKFFEKKTCFFWKPVIVYSGTQVSACAGSSVG